MYLVSIAIPICNSYHFKLQLNEKICIAILSGNYNHCQLQFNFYFHFACASFRHGGSNRFGCGGGLS